MTVSVKAPTSTTGSIQLNGSDVLTIDSSGNLTAPNNLTVTGTTTNTGAITSTGGIYLGGTVSANLLNDYEVGTWTPDLRFAGTSQSTYTGRTGGYVKVGRIVTATMRISGTASATGDIRIYGLPFVSDSPDSSDAIQTCAIWSPTLPLPGTGYAIGRIDQDGNTYVQPMFIINNGESSITWTSGSGFSMSFSITYLSA